MIFIDWFKRAARLSDKRARALEQRNEIDAYIKEVDKQIDLWYDLYDSLFKDRYDIKKR
jgi:hypothetical protein